MKPRNPYTPENRAETNYYKLGGSAFHLMKRYLRSMNDFLRSQKHQLQENHKEELEKFPEYPQLINEVYEREYKELDTYFLRILLRSSFVASFSIFELMFKEVCHLGAYKYHTKAEFDSNSGIDQYRSYIVRELRIDISDLKHYWKDLNRYRELRNCMIHSNSIIQGDQEHLIQFVKNLKHIKIRKIRKENQFEFTVLDKQFINCFLDSASEFLANVLLKLPAGRKKNLPGALARAKSGGA
jgi:hypothetical protein